jgi:tetratricopeptide (TPR) repeat protein
MSAPRAIALCDCFTGALEFQAGNWDVAEAALRESIRLYREIGAASGEALACQRLGVVLTARGRLEEGLAILQEGQAAAERALMRAHCLTRIYAAMARNRLAANDLAAAANALESGLSMGQRHGNCTTCDALLLPAAVSVRVAQGDFMGAADFCNRLERAAQQYASQVWIAMARQSRAELAEARRSLDDAVDDYLSAHHAFIAAGYDYEAARCLKALADAYAHRNAIGDEQKARDAGRQSQHILARLGLN